MEVKTHDKTFLCIKSSRSTEVIRAFQYNLSGGGSVRHDRLVTFPYMNMAHLGTRQLTIFSGRTPAQAISHRTKKYRCPRQ